MNTGGLKAERFDANEHDVLTANVANEEESMPQNEATFPDILELMRQSSAATRVNQSPAGRQARGLWRTLEAFAESHPPAAVLADWRHHTGADFTTMEAFLLPIARLAKMYPCLSATGCGDAHEVVALEDGRWVARSQEDLRYCPGIMLTEAELVVHELHTERFGGELCRALGFEPATRIGASEAAPKLWRVGTQPQTGSPVYLALCPSEGQLLLNLQALMTVCGEPFIVLSPTARSRSELAGAMLNRERCTFIPLASHLATDGPGRFRVTATIEPVLERFKAGWLPRIVPAHSIDKHGHDREAVGPRYSLRKHAGVWQLVFEGRKGFIDDERGVHIVAYLLRNPPVERIHAVKLERLVWAQSYVDEQPVSRSVEEEADLAAHLTIRSEAGGVARRRDDNDMLKWEVRELLEIIRDASLPSEERDEAQSKLDEISRALSGGGEGVGEATKAAGRVRKAINRLHAQLAVANNEKNEPHPVLREFAEHVRKYLMVPSARFTKTSTSRNRTGVAGTFTYEPPPGVIWEG